MRGGEDGPSARRERRLRRGNKNLQREGRERASRSEDGVRSADSRGGRVEEHDETGPERVSADERFRQVHRERDQGSRETAKADLERAERNDEKRGGLGRRAAQRGGEMSRERSGGSSSEIAENSQGHEGLCQVNTRRECFQSRKTDLETARMKARYIENHVVY